MCSQTDHRCQKFVEAKLQIYKHTPHPFMRRWRSEVVIGISYLIFNICHSIISKCAFICSTFLGVRFIFALQHQFCLIGNYTIQYNSSNVQFNNGDIKMTIEFYILPCRCAWGPFILKCTLFSQKKHSHLFDCLEIGIAFFELN